LPTTREKLQAELDELISSAPNKKVSISELARKVGISHSTIHNRHEAIANQIKAHNLTIDAENDATKGDKLKKIKAEKQQLLALVRQLEQDKTKLVSINARYELENAELKKKLNVLEQKQLKNKIKKIT